MHSVQYCMYVDDSKNLKIIAAFIYISDPKNGLNAKIVIYETLFNTS